MKILFVSAVLPWPLHSGGQIRIYNLLKRLSKMHDITLFSFIRDKNEEKLVDKLSFCKKVVTVFRGHAWRANYIFSSIIGKYPFLLETYKNSKMRDKIVQELGHESYDLIHLEPFYVWPSLPKTHLPIVASEHNIEYEVYQQFLRQFPVIPLRPLLYLDTLKLRFWEQIIWKKVEAVIAISEHDESVINKINKNVRRVPNGVDLDEFIFKESIKKLDGPNLLFVGNFKWLPNRDAAKLLIINIWPLISKRFPQARLRIVGRNMPSRLKSQAQGPALSVEEDVTDIGREFHKADILIAPLSIAGGTKFKILEAFATGLPVVTSIEGAGGIEAVSGKHYLQAAKPQDYVDGITIIWKNQLIRNRLVKNARKLVENKYNWEKIARTLDLVWKKTYEEHH